MPLPSSKIDFAGLAISSLVVKSSSSNIYDINAVFLSEALDPVGNLQDIFGPTLHPFYALSSNKSNINIGDPLFVVSSFRTSYENLADDLEDGEFDEDDSNE